MPRQQTKPVDDLRLLPVEEIEKFDSTLERVAASDGTGEPPEMHSGCFHVKSLVEDTSDVPYEDGGDGRDKEGEPLALDKLFR